VRIIADSTPGNLHHARCRAAYLLGGYVGGGLLTAAEAHAALRPAVAAHTAHLPAALKTIADCLAAGETMPITYEALEAERAQWQQRHPLPTLHLPTTLSTTLPTRLSTILRSRV
jgi:hypothetical protein